MDHGAKEEEMSAYRTAALITALALGVSATPAAAAEPPPGTDIVDTYPLAQGDYTTANDFGWIYFKTPDGRACGIGPLGGPVGCDAVPYDAPPGTNQTVIASWGPAGYVHSDEPTFTRDVDTLPEGHRLQNWLAGCAVGYQGTVDCKSGEHGFVLSAVYGVLW
jgi:hypothetical protein